MPRPILPELPPISDTIRSFLVSRGDSAPFDRTLHYIQTGEITIDELLKASEARKKALKDAYEQWRNQPEPPDPREQQDWREILPMMGDPTQSGALGARLENYINKYDATRPSGNHVDEAKRNLQEILKAKEKKEWDDVDKMDYQKLLNYYRRHPQTSFFTELDDSAWAVVKALGTTDKVSRFINDFPTSSHILEAQQWLAGIVEWDKIKRQGDVFTVGRYLRDHPESPFKNEVAIKFSSLKDAEINEMRVNTKYEIDRFFRLMEEDIFTQDELIYEGVVSENSLETLRNLDDIKNNQLPNLDFTRPAQECPPGATDVYFFGVPSTGKTCIIMGLLGSGRFVPDYASYGGEYASDLSQFLDAGITPGSTQGDFVTLIRGSICDSENSDVQHPINVIDMSGEEFAFRISKNEDAKLSFEEMGTGATNLLTNDNRKIFFLVVDPTTDVIRYNRVVQTTDFAGNTNAELRRITVNQKAIIKGFVSLFSQPENRKVMERVDAIHIIVSKADVLDANEGGSRITQAKDIVRNQFSQELTKLRSLCSEKNLAINATTGYLPQLYTFSVGHFYVGDIFDYRPDDADSLIGAIERFSYGLRDKNFLDKIRDVLNTKVL